MRRIFSVRSLGIILLVGILTSAAVVYAVEKTRVTYDKKDIKGVANVGIVYKITPDLFLTHNYRDNQLDQIRLSNRGIPVTVRIFDKTYHLGVGDSVDIEPPTHYTYFIHVSPTTKETIHHPLLTNGHERTFIVHLKSVEKMDNEKMKHHKEKMKHHKKKR